MSEQPYAVQTNTELGDSRAPKELKSNGKALQEDTTMILEKTQRPPMAAEERFHIRPATMGDLEAAVELYDLCSKHMIGKTEATLSDVRTEWIMPEFDLKTATRVVETAEGRLVGYIEVWDIDDRPVNLWVWGRVHPDYEGQGIGSMMMDWAEGRAREALDRVPDDLKVVMRSGAYDGYTPASDFLQDRGMKPIRHFYTMAVELDQRPPEPKWPTGITIRSMSGLEEARDVVWAVVDAFRDHWGHVEQPFEQEYERWLHYMKHDDSFDPDLYYLAMAGDQIAGLALCKLESQEDKNMGWVRVLGVRRPWRRQGLGLALLHYSFGELYLRGKARVGLGVDASSLTGATRLYERAGMAPIRQFNTYELVLRPGRDISLQNLE